jgi:hypothetical protein
MMSTLYRALVTIAGRPVSGSWNGDNVVGVGELDIPWGRRDVYDDVEASVLTATLIDPHGTLATDTTLMGAEVTVAPEGLIQPSLGRTELLFRGTINDVTSRPVTVHNPRTNRAEDVWEVTIKATDPLAELAGAVLPGPVRDEPGYPYAAQPIYPRRVGFGERGTDIMNAGANKIISGWYAPDASWMPYLHVVEYRDADDRLSLYELFKRLYHYAGFSWVNYDHDSNWLQYGQLARADGLGLSYDGTTVTLDPKNALVLDGRLVSYAGDDSIRQTILSAIDVIKFNWSSRFYNTADPAAAQDPRKAEVHVVRTNHYNAAQGGLRTLEVDTDIGSSVTGSQTSPTVQSNVGAVADRYLEAVNAFNGKVTPPVLRWAFDRAPRNDDLAETLLRLRTRARPIFIAGSIYNGMPNIGPFFQLIGGTVRYHKTPSGDMSWEVDMILAPALVKGSPGNLTLNQLTTETTSTLEQFADDIHIGDLGHLTEGI